LSIIPQNTTFSQTFLLVSSSDHISPVLGASPVVLVSKNAENFISPEGIVTEIGDGWYNILLTVNDTNTLGMLSFHISATGADATDFSDQIVLPQVIYPIYPGYIPPDVLTGGPSIAGFVGFIYGPMGVPTTALSPSDPIIQFCYDWAINVVYDVLQFVPSQLTSPSVYAVAVYNLGAATLCQYAYDQPLATPPTTPPTYWADLRKGFNLNTFVGGVVNFGSDQSTSGGFAVPEGLKNLTVGDLQLLKTPWGVNYAGIAQNVGTLWGMS
jgi:hypothetical protein